MKLIKIIFALILIQNSIPNQPTEEQPNVKVNFNSEITNSKENNSVYSSYTYDYNSSRSNKSN